MRADNLVGYIIVAEPKKLLSRMFSFKVFHARNFELLEFVICNKGEDVPLFKYIPMGVENAREYCLETAGAVVFDPRKLSLSPVLTSLLIIISASLLKTLEYLNDSGFGETGAEEFSIVWKQDVTLQGREVEEQLEQLFRT